MEKFFNKLVQIYPGDSRSKFGKVMEVDSYGVTFLITKSSCASYALGSLHYISHSKGLTLRLMDGQ